MKQITIKNQPRLSSTPDITRFYGVENSVGDKGFITRNGYQSTNTGGPAFLILSPFVQLTAGNSFGDGCFPFTSSLAELIEYIVNAKFEVFEFDSFKELTSWLNEEEDAKVAVECAPKARKPPLTIQGLDGKVHRLSQQKYQIKGQNGEFRLINGLDGSKKIGYHRVPGWVCLCPVNANLATWYGEKKSDLVKVS